MSSSCCTLDALLPYTELHEHLNANIFPFSLQWLKALTALVASMWKTPLTSVLQP